MKPLIGITTGEIFNRDDPWSPVTYGQSHTYSDVIIRAGGVPLLIPITNDKSVLLELYNRLDGILFAGGNDLNPILYGESPLAQTKDFSEQRDIAEMWLMEWALQSTKPLLGVCRGMQLLNVIKGGTLYQDIATQLLQASDHGLSSKLQDGEHIAHQLKIADGSKLAHIINTDSLNANTHHHQAIKKLGNGLAAVAWAEDDVIEAIEIVDDSKYGLGFQCHPESLSRVEPKWDKVFGSFVVAAKAAH